jgi:hypothetical protein
VKKPPEPREPMHCRRCGKKIYSKSPDPCRCGVWEVGKPIISDDQREEIERHMDESRMSYTAKHNHNGEVKHGK